MPSPVVVESLVFTFHVGVAAQKYDEWTHVNQHWTARQGKKKVDVVAVYSASPASNIWLIEAKDFRIITSPPKPSNLGALPQTVFEKVRDTLLGLADTAANGQIASEKAHATAAMASGMRRVVLHLESHSATGTHTALFPSNFAVNVYQSLKILVAAIDPQPLVLNIANTPQAGVPWSVS